MRRVLVAALVVILTGALSCSEMPTAPQQMVTVAGSIRDRDGAGLSGTQLFFRMVGAKPQPAGPSDQVNTDAGGNFRITLAPAVYEVIIQPDYRTGIPAARIPRFEAKGSAARLDYRCLGTRLSGNITGPGGTTLADASVNAYSFVGDTFVSAQSVGGHYSLLLPPGVYQFGVQSGNYDDGLPRLDFQATIGAVDSTLDFALTGNEVTVTVTLGGSPLSGARIIAGSGALGIQASATSDLDGIAAIYLPDGGYSYFVSPPSRYIIGPESGYWSISGSVPVAISFPGTRWDATLRRSADNGVVPSAYVSVNELGSNRYASARTDAFGRFRLIVRPDVGYDLQISLPNPNPPNLFTIPNVSSAADSTFDLLVDAPVP